MIDAFIGSIVGVIVRLIGGLIVLGLVLLLIVDSIGLLLFGVKQLF